MSEWQVNVFTDDEEVARNLVDELHGEGFGVSLLKREVRETETMVLQFAHHPRTPDTRV